MVAPVAALTTGKIRPAHFSAISEPTRTAILSTSVGTRRSAACFFRKSRPEVHARGRCGGHQKFDISFFARVFEAVKQANFLEHAQGNRGKNSDIRHHGHETAQPETQTFERCHLRRRRYGLARNRVDDFRAEVKHLRPRTHRQAVFPANPLQVCRGIDAHLAVRGHESQACRLAGRSRNPVRLGPSRHTYIVSADAPRRSPSLWKL